MRCLIVDDEFVSLTKLMVLMKEFGTCDAATHAVQALEMFRKAAEAGTPYDLITIDIEMPGVNGLQLLQLIGREEGMRKLRPARKVMISASSSRSNVTQALLGHCDGFLVKPANRERLVACLAKMGLGILPGKPADAPAPAAG